MATLYRFISISGEKRTIYLKYVVMLSKYWLFGNVFLCFFGNVGTWTASQCPPSQQSWLSKPFICFFFFLIYSAFPLCLFHFHLQRVSSWCLCFYFCMCFVPRGHRTQPPYQLYQFLSQISVLTFKDTYKPWKGFSCEISTNKISKGILTGG